jgi:tRNA nucleotidyltransferase (CCA-adding enzyme)
VRVDGKLTIERAAELPGGYELLALAAERPERIELVGGAVRDILLGRVPRELDVVVHGDAAAVARELAGRLGGEVETHEQFGTALVRWPAGQIDLAGAREESYPQPGSLPQVRPGTPEQDLDRRDFTVNAIAVALAGEHAGQLRAARHALEDLKARTLRVLHDGSFRDDPTRILRMARYRARLGFSLEPHTAELAKAALGEGALRTVSGARLGAEVRLALAEEDALSALAELDRLGVFEAWEPGICFDEHLARAALEVLPTDGEPRLMLVASMLLELMGRMQGEDTEPAMLGFLHDLELPSGQAQRAFGAAIAASCAARMIDGSETTDELLELLDSAAVEGLALAAAMGDVRWGPRSYTRTVVEDWLSKHRHIRLHITGEDLIAAGLPEGPEIGRRLERVFAMRMTGQIDEDREAELCAALEEQGA